MREKNLDSPSSPEVSKSNSKLQSRYKDQTPNELSHGKSPVLALLQARALSTREPDMSDPPDTVISKARNPLTPNSILFSQMGFNMQNNEGQDSNHDLSRKMILCANTPSFRNVSPQPISEC